MELITTPNPNAKKIEIEHGLTAGTVINSSDDVENKICSAILGISGVSSIFVGPDFLTVTKEARAEWDSINNDIVAQFDKL
jgi:hypothetical protein